LIKNKDLSREYEFYKQKVSVTIENILEELKATVLDRTRINGVQHRRVVMGYKLLSYFDNPEYEW